MSNTGIKYVYTYKGNPAAPDFRTEEEMTEHIQKFLGFGLSLDDYKIFKLVPVSIKTETVTTTKISLS